MNPQNLSIRKLVKNLLTYLGLSVSRIATIGPESDSEFMNLYQQVRTESLLGPIKLYIIAQFLKYTVSLPGNAGEFGVYKGGSAFLLADILQQTSPNKILHLFDTFTGMPESDPEKDLHKEGDFDDVTFEDVSRFLSIYRNVRLHKGLFEDTLPNIVNDEQFCFVHIDCDIYNSVLQCCNFLYSRIVPGGIMVFDDYGSKSCPGCKLAIDQFFINKQESPIHLPPTGQCLVIKCPTFNDWINKC